MGKTYILSLINSNMRPVIIILGTNAHLCGKDLHTKFQLDQHSGGQLLDHLE
jgi:hypothetical protein